MTLIAWDAIRHELDRVQVLIQHETPEGHDSPRLRTLAADHLRTALLLLGGAASRQIVGHARGSIHDVDTPHISI